MNISVRNLHYTYPNGHTALHGFDLDIPAGQRVAIVGQNGGGKTTLVRHLNGLFSPTSGDVLIGDWNTRQHPVHQLAARVGYVFQNPDEQLFCKTVQEEVEFGPRNLGFGAQRVQQLAGQALAQTALQAHAHKNPYDLSPAWRKMVAIASVLAMDPAILVLDEPTTGQDAAGVARVAAVVATAAAQGKTVIAISHDMDFVAENFDRLIAIYDGRLLADGPTEQIMPQAGLLAQTGVEPAQLTRLGTALNLPTPILTQHGLLAALKQR